LWRTHSKSSFWRAKQYAFYISSIYVLTAITYSINQSSAIHFYKAKCSTYVISAKCFALH